MNFRLAAFDLDGSLLDGSGTVSERTAETLGAVAESGVCLVAATGRSHHSLNELFTDCPEVHWAICSNGATLYHLPTNTVRWHRPLRDRDVRSIVDDVKTELPGAHLAWETSQGHTCHAGFDLVSPLGERCRRVHDSTSLPGSVIKLFIGHEHLHHYDLLDVVEPLVPETVELTTSGARFLEATGPGVNKASSLALLCGELGIQSEEVIAFGDNHNDRPMLVWAGRGYAMANAHESALHATAYRTELPNTQDGVAHTLTSLFLAA